MRLINTQDLTLEEFTDSAQAPRYAILSHRWEEEEVTYQEMQNLTDNVMRKKGFLKIKHCCERTSAYGISYAWVDTCCIDKSSSAELSEAINSMFHWYEQCVICFAYLGDVLEDGLDAEESFTRTKSQWFTRGWTLQELIAPSDLEFLDQNWKLLGKRMDFADSIEKWTRIPKSLLTVDDTDRLLNLNQFSIATKMAWAAGRDTKRQEDRAYSLMGLFKVNMPMLYGEGKRAFIRLQEEIVKQTNDHSIFLWSLSESSQGQVLASSPDAFEPIFDVEVTKQGLLPYSMTNLGLSMQIVLAPWGFRTYVAILECSGVRHISSTSFWKVGIFLKRIENSDIYGRVRVNEEDFCLLDPYLQLDERRGMRRHQVYLLTQPDSHFKFAGNRNGGRMKLHLPTFYKSSSLNESYRVIDGSFSEAEDLDRQVLDIPNRMGGVASILLAKTETVVGAVKIGFDFDFNPVCIIAHKSCIVPDLRTAPLWELRGLCRKHLNNRYSSDLTNSDIFAVNCMETEGWTKMGTFTAPFHVSLRHYMVVAYSKHGKWALKGLWNQSTVARLCDENHSLCDAGLALEVFLKRESKDLDWTIEVSVVSCECLEMSGNDHKEGCFLIKCRERQEKLQQRSMTDPTS